MSQLQIETAALLAIPPSKVKRLRSFLGSEHYINKFTPNPAQLGQPLRTRLKKSVIFLWIEEHTKHFNIINKIAANTENSHNNPNLVVLVKGEASRSGLGAALDQSTSDG